MTSRSSVNNAAKGTKQARVAAATTPRSTLAFTSSGKATRKSPNTSANTATLDTEADSQNGIMNRGVLATLQLSESLKR